MSEDKFDAIVVGAGVAGSVAALVMARAGLDVLVIERGDSAGCKNMTGGRLYAHTLEAIIPGFAVSIFTASNQMFRNTHLIPYCVIVWTRG